MIERPKRSVTRFFIPLIDVMILLFCIFLLMPFMSQPGSADPGEKQTASKQQSEIEELTKLNAGLRIDLERSRRDVKQLQQERINPAESVSIRTVSIDPVDGMLFVYREGKRQNIEGRRAAEEIIDDHRHISRIEGKEPLFLLLMPHEAKSGIFTIRKLNEFRKWFDGVPFKIESTHRNEVPVP